MNVDAKATANELIEQIKPLMTSVFEAMCNCQKENLEDEAMEFARAVCEMSGAVDALRRIAK